MKTKPEGNALIDLIDESVEAIRKDPLVGKGTCSMIDECMDDKDIIERLLDQFKFKPFTTVRQALKIARDWEGLYLEQALNCREGNDSDPELKIYREFRTKRKADGI